MSERTSAYVRGHAFADAMFELVRTYGPVELPQAEKDALTTHLIGQAVEWVKARNQRITEGAEQ